MPIRTLFSSRDSDWRLLLPLGLLPLSLLAVYDSGAQVQSLFGKTMEDVWQAVSIAAAVLGVMVRFLAAGSQTDRPDGVYSVVRHPAVLGNLLILAGVALGTQVWWFTLIAGLSFAIYYEHAAARSDAARRQVFGERYEDWAARTPALLPAFGLWKTPERPFAWSAALAREFGALYFVVAYSVLMEISVDLRTGYATPGNWPADWPYYFGTLFVATLCGAAVLVGTRLGPRTSSVASPAVAPAVPATRGIRVDGRARLVDTLENLISGGQQEAILRATLDAASLSPGDRMLDVGCGTGKLAVSAARRVGASGTVIGLDATPAMIDLATARARAANVRAEFRYGVGEALPFPNASFDVVTSTYFFHHLPGDIKAEALREMWDVLGPGGRLVITDYGKPRSLLGYIASIPMRFDFHEYVRPQLRGELEELIADANLGEPEVTASFLGYINVLRLVKK